MHDRIQHNSTVVVIGAGASGIAADSLSIDELATALHVNVRSILGSDAPDPIDYSTTDWGNDPYALGAYSHSSLNTLGNEKKYCSIQLLVASCSQAKLSLIAVDMSTVRGTMDKGLPLYS